MRFRSLATKLLPIAPLLLAAAAAVEQPPGEAGANNSNSNDDDDDEAGVVTVPHNLLAERHHPSTLERAIRVLQDGRLKLLPQKEEEKEEEPSSSLRDGGPRRLQEAPPPPSWLFVQMFDECDFQITDKGNLIVKSRRPHGQTIKFADRPLTYEESMPTQVFFDEFGNLFTVDNGGMPNAAITLVQDDESKDVVVTVLVKAVVNHRENPAGPAYVYKLEQSDEQASVMPLSDILGGKDKVTYDHCSIFIDSVTTTQCQNGFCPAGIGTPCKFFWTTICCCPPARH
jgi:hypothetical protein